MIKKLLLVFLLTYPQFLHSSVEADFITWLNQFKIAALKKGISEETITNSFKNAEYLENVIKYDRRQPEFFEDTETYIRKRATRSRMLKAKGLLKKNKKLFNEIENKFNVEKELLLALWGIETNFGRNVGKMDIISSLATLSFDKRRSEFFSNELIILLKLIDQKLIDVDTLYGSWAGAFGNFQFMPSAIKNYAIDYDKNKKIELKESIHDAIASAANYINKIGWNNESLCFSKVQLTNEISEKYVNISAKKILNYRTIKFWKKKGIIIMNQVNDNSKAALVIPDLAVSEGNKNSPAFLVFKNYETILKWNRSLRFGITVCTLANMIKNEI
jgi:membrane-bound lytic murein transglycosylase B